jgi:hypothetical protein
MAHFSLTIPESYKEPLAALLHDETMRRKLLDALGHASPTELIENLASAVAEQLRLDPHKARDMFDMLASMYMVRTRRDIPLDEFIDGIERAAKQSGREQLKASENVWSQFKTDLRELLSLDQSLGISAKAIELRQDQDHIFCSARILTDLRPVFKADVHDDPAAAVITHTLRISYHEGDKREEFFVALDGRDIESLQQLLKRAVDKEQTVRRVSKAAGLPCLDIEARH